MIPHDPHHSFSIGLAEKYGVLEAIFIHHFQHWIRLNKKLNKNLKEGKTWTYQSVLVFQAHFSYLSIKQIRGVIDRLVRKGVIVKGNFNKFGGDKTLWYAFADETFTCSTVDICPKGQSELPEKAIGSAQKGEAIPDDKTDHKDKIKKTNKKEKEANASVAAVAGGCCRSEPIQNTLEKDGLPETIIYANVATGQQLTSGAVETEVLIRILEKKGYSKGQISRAVKSYLECLTPVRNFFKYIEGIIKRLEITRHEPSKYFNRSSNKERGVFEYKRPEGFISWKERCDELAATDNRKLQLSPV